MKFINYAMAAVAATCLALAGPLSAQTAAANSIEAINAAPQGTDIAVRIDFKEPLAAPPTGFSVAKPAKIAFDFPSTANGLGKNSLALLLPRDRLGIVRTCLDAKFLERSLLRFLCGANAILVAWILEGHEIPKSLVCWSAASCAALAANFQAAAGQFSRALRARLPGVPATQGDQPAFALGSTRIVWTARPK